MIADVSGAGKQQAREIAGVEALACSQRDAITLMVLHFYSKCCEYAICIMRRAGYPVVQVRNLFAAGQWSSRRVYGDTFFTAPVESTIVSPSGFSCTKVGPGVMNTRAFPSLQLKGTVMWYEPRGMPSCQADRVQTNQSSA